MEATTIQFSVSREAVVVLFLSIIAIIICILPFIFHIKQRNFPAICLVFWIILINIFNFVNALLWPTDNIESWWNGVGWCDIQVKLVIGSTLGIPGAVASIMRRLVRALDTDNTVLMASERQRRIDLIVNILLCVCLPVYGIVIHYIIQPTRYYIFAVSGCIQSFDNSWPTIVLYYVWPTIICLIASYYCGKHHSIQVHLLEANALAAIVIYRIQKYSTNFGSIIESSATKLSKNRFLRLLGVAMSILLIFLPSEAYILYKNAEFPLETYSWAAIHGSEWGTIIEEPSSGTVIFDRWIRIAAGFLIFFSFGLGNEATSIYRRWLIKFGFAKIFPSLGRPRVSRQNFNSSTNTSSKESYASKFKLWARRISADSSASTMVPAYRKRILKLTSRLSKFLGGKDRETLPQHTVTSHQNTDKSMLDISGCFFQTSPQWLNWSKLHSAPDLHDPSAETEKPGTSVNRCSPASIIDKPDVTTPASSHLGLSNFIKNYQPLLRSTPFQTANPALQLVIQEPKPTAMRKERHSLPPRDRNLSRFPINFTMPTPPPKDESYRIASTDHLTPEVRYHGSTSTFSTISAPKIEAIYRATSYSKPSFPDTHQNFEMVYCAPEAAV
ncbi:MAG: a-factor receptor [Icmadophila ericetorum]|nr:a-factor receptor [Icmadophila ericetorum]